MDDQTEGIGQEDGIVEKRENEFKKEAK